MYRVYVSPDLISRVTYAVHEEVLAWRSHSAGRDLAGGISGCPRVKIRADGVVRTKAVHVALGLTLSGDKAVLGLWIEQTDGAKFWLSVLNELKGRGVEDFLIVVATVSDRALIGLRDFPRSFVKQGTNPHLNASRYRSPVTRQANDRRVSGRREIPGGLEIGQRVPRRE